VSRQKELRQLLFRNLVELDSQACSTAGEWRKIFTSRSILSTTPDKDFFKRLRSVIGL
jgi:hypothetical protein